jgi:hypothetical protein
MAAALKTPQLSFRYHLIDIREIPGEGLLKSDRIGDNVIAILTRLRDRRSALHEIVRKVSELDDDARGFYLQALLTLAGLRGLEDAAEEEARKVPILIDILENKVLGREFKRGLQEGRLGLLRHQMEARFGVLPKWAEDRLVSRSPKEIEEIGVRLLKAESLDELLK